MPVRITCRKGHTHLIGEQHVGKQVKCPTCAEPIQVPVDNAKTEASSQSVAPSNILAACPQGHQIKVDARLVGKRGRCPVCKQVFEIQVFNATSQSSPFEQIPIQQTSESTSPIKTTSKSLLIAVTLGSVLGLVMSVGLGAWLLGGHSNDDVVAQKTDAVPTPDIESADIESATQSTSVPNTSTPETESVPSVRHTSTGGAILEAIKEVAVELELGITKGPSYLPKSHIYHTAYDEKNGRLICAMSDYYTDSGAISIYDIDAFPKNKETQPLKNIPTRRMPTGVVFKEFAGKRFLIFGQQKSSELQIYDADTFQPVKEISIGGGEVIEVRDIAAPRMDDVPYVYFVATLRQDAAPNSARLRLSLGRINLQTMQHDASVEIDEPGARFEAGEINISACGRFLYSYNQSYSIVMSGGLLSIKKLNEVDPNAQRRLIPGPHGFHVFGDDASYDKEMSIPFLKTRGAKIVGVGRDSAWVLGVKRPAARGRSASRRSTLIESYTMTVYSGNSGATISGADFNLLADGKGHTVAPPRFGFKDTRLKRSELWGFVDASRRLAVFGKKDQFQINTKLLEDLPDEPWLTLRSRLPTKCEAGRELVIPLESLGGENVKFELISTVHNDGLLPAWPENVTFLPADTNKISIADGQLTFSSEPGQFGSHAIGLRASLGNVTKNIYVQFKMVSPPSDLPFFVNGVAFEAGSHHAVIWGNDASLNQSLNGDAQNRDNAPGDATFFVGVYDCNKRELLMQREMPVEIFRAAISADGVYVAMNSPAKLIRLNRTTLQPEKAVDLPERAKWITSVANKYIATNLGRFEIPSLKPMPLVVDSWPNVALQLSDEAWIWDGLLWDKKMEKPQMLVQPVGFGFRGFGSGRQFVKGIKYYSAGPILTAAASRSPLSPPAGSIPGTLLSVKAKGGTGGMFASLYSIAGKTLETKTLVAPPSFLGGTHTNDLFVAAGASHSAIVFQGKLVLLPHTAWKQQAPIPFHFLPKQSTFELDPLKENTVTYSAPGATKYTLRLSIPNKVDGLSNIKKPDVSIESTDGTFRFRFNAASQFGQIVDWVSNRGISSANPYLNRLENQKSKSAQLAEYQNRMTPLVRSMTGKAPRKTPIPIFALVEAENDMGEKTALLHWYFAQADLPAPTK